MEMERRALYNLLRMNCLRSQASAVEQWQIDDYRALTTEALFERLHDLDIETDLKTFTLLSKKCDTPEDLSDLLTDDNADAFLQDKVYLIVFELWRRLIPEKPSFSIFCDELDNTINLYDRNELEDLQHLEDLLTNLQVILDENVDEGGTHENVFKTLIANCANDIESFLYDFISEELDNGNYSYASELLEGFSDYPADKKRFSFLKARLIAHYDPTNAATIIKELFSKTSKIILDPDFCFDVLAFLAQNGSQDLFASITKKTLRLIETEDDFHELLEICVDYFHYLDNDKKEHAVTELIAQREGISLDAPLKKGDPARDALFALIEYAPASPKK